MRDSDKDISWKIFAIYLGILGLMLLGKTAFGQNIVVTHFNAGWNNPNKVKYIGDLTDCDLVYVDIAVAPKLQKKHNIIVVPTVIIYKEGKERKRFQADISFSMKATKCEMQNFINQLVKEDF
jgi:hypothetical protein|tara:strand:+ start:2270 stop:2638 length:369 start_codon:yes stop_codon:yes gene_type:complete